MGRKGITEIGFWRDRETKGSRAARDMVGRGAKQCSFSTLGKTSGKMDDEAVYTVNNSRLYGREYKSSGRQL